MKQKCTGNYFSTMSIAKKNLAKSLLVKSSFTLHIRTTVTVIYQPNVSLRGIIQHVAKNRSWNFGFFIDNEHSGSWSANYLFKSTFQHHYFAYLPYLPFYFTYLRALIWILKDEEVKLNCQLTSTLFVFFWRSMSFSYFDVSRLKGFCEMHM